MFVDQTSLLLALGFAAFALSTTLFVTWLSARSEYFILTWAAGAGIMVLAFAAFSINAIDHSPALLWLANMLLTGGFIVFYGAACLFTERRLPKAWISAVGGGLLSLVTLPFILGFDALGALFGNLSNALLLFMTAEKFWRGREEAPAWVGGIVTLYSITGISFIPCAVLIYLKGPLVLETAPSGWAEDLNSIVGLVGMTSIGALSLALNQARAARRHRNEAHTDALTGLLNRRALFERFATMPAQGGLVAMIFDLDHFKSINDRHGHQAGDAVLRHFADVVRQNLRSVDVAARLGGEEFVIILINATPALALAIAEAVRTTFSEGGVGAETGLVQTTVSAGIALHVEGEALDQMINRADKALYLAKESGRNRVVSAAS